jgi:hypothetical protein
VAPLRGSLATDNVRLSRTGSPIAWRSAVSALCYDLVGRTTLTWTSAAATDGFRLGGARASVSLTQALGFSRTISALSAVAKAVHPT